MKENKKMKDNFISLKDISSELIRRSEEKAERLVLPKARHLLL